MIHTIVFTVDLSSQRVLTSSATATSKFNLLAVHSYSSYILHQMMITVRVGILKCYSQTVFAEERVLSAQPKARMSWCVSLPASSVVRMTRSYSQHASVAVARQGGWGLFGCGSFVNRTYALHRIWRNDVSSTVSVQLSNVID